MDEPPRTTLRFKRRAAARKPPPPEIDRSSHVTLGGDSDEWKSSTRSEYRDWGRDDPRARSESKRMQKELETNLRSSHFVLGGEPVDYSTSNTFIDPRDVGMRATGLSEDVRKDLRATHFTFGSASLDYVSTLKASTAAVESARELRPTKKEGLTSEQIKDLRSSHFVLGVSKPELTSVARDSFGFDPKAYTAAAGVKNKGAELRESHFSCGHDAVDYSTTTGDAVDRVLEQTSALKARGVKPSDGLDKKAAAELRASHFKLGDFSSDFSTTSAELFVSSPRRL